jgi:hypothetical protein
MGGSLGFVVRTLIVDKKGDVVTRFTFRQGEAPGSDRRR